MTETVNKNPIVITKEEQFVIEAAMSNLDVVLSNHMTKALANRLNVLYSLVVSSMNAFTKISHAMNIDNKDAINGISLGMQRALYEFITSPQFVENVMAPEKKEESVEKDDKKQEDVENVVSNENVNNVVMIDKWRKNND